MKDVEDDVLVHTKKFVIALKKKDFHRKVFDLYLVEMCEDLKLK